MTLEGVGSFTFIQISGIIKAWNERLKMSNMSYCRFENTSSDLEDCVYAMSEAETLADMDLSKYEKAAMLRMQGLCQEFLQNMERFGNFELEEEDE